MKLTRLIFATTLILALQPTSLATKRMHESAPSSSNSIHGGKLTVEVFNDGSYALRSAVIPGDVLRSHVEVDTAAGTLKSSLYPPYKIDSAAFTDELGSGQSSDRDPYRVARHARSHLRVSCL